MQALICCVRRDNSRKRLTASPLPFQCRVIVNCASVSDAEVVFRSLFFFWPALENCGVYFMRTIHHGGT